MRPESGIESRRSTWKRLKAWIFELLVPQLASFISLFLFFSFFFFFFLLFGCCCARALISWFFFFPLHTLHILLLLVFF